MTDKEKIKKEIKGLRKVKGHRPIYNCDLCDAYQARGYQIACDDIIAFIDSLPEEPASEDLKEEPRCGGLEEEFDKVWFDEGFGDRFDNSAVDFANVKYIARYFSEWQRNQMMKDAVSETAEPDPMLTLTPEQKIHLSWQQTKF